MGAAFEVKLKNPGKYEVLTTAVSLRGHSRKLVVVACYIPPGYSRERGAGALEHVSEVVIDLKRRYKDPYIVVAGDFNQWKVGDYLEDFADIKEVEVGNSRGRRAIDRIFLNFTRSVQEYGTLEPLESEENKRSDHKIAYVRATIQKRASFKWEKYTYRHFNDDSVRRFREWVVMHGWEEVLLAVTSEEKALAYQGAVVGAVERFFPLRTVRRKDTDPPWLDKKTKKMLEDRKSLFFEEGGRACLLYTSPSPRDRQKTRMPSSA